MTFILLRDQKMIDLLCAVGLDLALGDRLASTSGAADGTMITHEGR